MSTLTNSGAGGVINSEEESNDTGSWTVKESKKRRISESPPKQQRSSQSANGRDRQRNKTNNSRRNSNAETNVLNRLYGLGEEGYILHCVLEDDVKNPGDDKDPRPESPRLSDQSLPMLDTLLHQALGVAGNEERVMKINKFKKKDEKKFKINVTLFSEAHLRTLLSLRKIGVYPIKASENFQKNCIQGTFQDYKEFFKDVTEADILAYIQRKGETGVCKVARLGKGSTISVWFRGQTLPKMIDLGVATFNIRPFENKPRRCAKCQSYDHLKYSCSNKYRCFKCAHEYENEDDHDPKDCKEPSKCIHCAKTHTTGFWKCEVEKKELAWLKISSERKIPLKEAKKRFPDGMVAPFSVAAGSPFVTPILQTSFGSPSTGSSSNQANPAVSDNHLSELQKQNSQIVNMFTTLLHAVSSSPDDSAPSSTPTHNDAFSALQQQVNSLAARVDASEKENHNLKQYVAKQNKVIGQQKEILKLQEKALADISSPNRDLYHANIELIKQMETLKEENNKLRHIINVKEAGTNPLASASHNIQPLTTGQPPPPTPNHQPSPDMTSQKPPPPQPNNTSPKPPPLPPDPLNSPDTSPSIEISQSNVVKSDSSPHT